MVPTLFRRGNRCRFANLADGGRHVTPPKRRLGSLLASPLVLAGLVGCLLALSGCSEPEPPPPPVVEAPKPPLRVVVRPAPISVLPHETHPVEVDRKIAEGLSKYLDRELEWIILEDYPKMVETLLAGDADLIACSVTVTDSREKEVAFSLPYLTVDELLIVPAAEADSMKTIDDLAGCEVTVRASSSFYETLANVVPDVDVRINIAPENYSSDHLAEAVEEERFSATLLDSNYWFAVASHFPDLAAPLVVAEDRPVALALHPDETQLRTRVNEYLIFRALTGGRDGIYVDDLPELTRRNRLRVLTHNHASTYFLHRGTQRGFEYELLERFAQKQGLLLEIVIPPSSSELIPWLEEGRGDVIAAALTITPERAKRVKFTRRFMSVDQVVVTRLEDADVLGWHDLEGRSIAVRRSSAFYETLKKLEIESRGVEIVLTPEDMETEQVLELVEAGEYDLTLCDSHILAIEQTYGRRLHAAFSVGATDLGWAVRPTNPKLHAALDDYLAREYRGLHYNIIARRYFENDKYMEMSQDTYRSDLSGKISPYDELAQIYAERNDLDWRLLVALMYQESRFDPNSESWAGARGLTQIMPATARELGVTDLSDPSESVRAGATYLRQQLDRFEPDLRLEDRIRFALASYNAGAGHVQDARRLARKQGWNPDRWFGNVERAMLLLQKPAYYEKARFGYCRGSETVRYVRRIEELYRRFVDHVPDRAALAEPDSVGTGLR